MTINFNVKVTSGKRTPIRVDVYSTSVNSKQIELQDSGRSVDELMIASWIQKELTAVLERYKTAKSTDTERINKSEVGGG